MTTVILFNSSASLTNKYYFNMFLSVLFIILLYILISFFGAQSITKKSEILIYLAFFIFAPILTLLLTFLASSTPNQVKHVSFNKFNNILNIVLPISIILYGFKGIYITLYHTEYETSVLSLARFSYGTIIVLFLCLTIVLVKNYLVYPSIFTNKFLKLTFKWFAYILGFTVITLLFDINITPDTLSYAPYFGPAMGVLNNQIPLVDVFSQYGLNYLLFSLALTILPWSIFSTTLIVAALNIIYYYIFALITVKLSNNKLFALFCIVVSILFLHSASLYNVTYTPSVLAMRFLPTALLTLSLTYIPKNRSFTLATIASMGLCSMWSIESFALSFGIYITYSFINAISKKQSGIRNFTVDSTKIIACLTIPHLILCLFYLVSFGVMPKYNIYLELVSGQESQQGWVQQIDPDVKTWILFGFTYAITLCFSIIFVAKKHRYNENTNRFFASISAISVLGIGQFAYFIGRSMNPVLIFIAFPLTTLFVIFIDRVYSDFNNNKNNAPTVIFGALGIIILSLMGGVFMDRFYRPLTPMISNSTILRSCILNSTRDCSVTGIIGSIAELMKEPTGFPQHAGAAGYVTTDENAAAYILINKWQPNEKKVLLFITDTANVLFLSKKLHRLDIAHSMVDGLSPTLTKNVLKKTEAIRANDILIVGYASLPFFDQKIISYLKTQWEFCLLETVGTVSAYRLKPLKNKNREDGSLVTS